MEEAANAEARARAEQRIATALEANRSIAAAKRREYDLKQQQNEERRKYDGSFCLACATTFCSHTVRCHHDNEEQWE